MPELLRYLVISIQLTAFFRLSQQLILEARIGNINQLFHHGTITLTTEIGNTIFGDHNVFKVPWNGDIAIVEHNVRLKPFLALMGTFKQ